MSADDDRDFASSGDPVPAPADPVTDPVLLEVRAALAAARTLPLAEQPAALEAALDLDAVCIVHGD